MRLLIADGGEPRCSLHCPIGSCFDVHACESVKLGQLVTTRYVEKGEAAQILWSPGACRAAARVVARGAL